MTKRYSTPISQFLIGLNLLTRLEFGKCQGSEHPQFVIEWHRPECRSWMLCSKQFHGRKKCARIINRQGCRILHGKVLPTRWQIDTRRTTNGHQALDRSFTRESELAKRTVAGNTPGVAKMPRAKRAVEAASRPIRTSRISNCARTVTPFACSTTTKRTMILLGGLFLHHQNSFNNLIGVRAYLRRDHALCR